MAAPPRLNWSSRSALSFALVVMAFAPAEAAPIITEFLAGNDSILADEDGDYSDWIEIFNPAPTTLDLSGYYLTDEATNLAKWRIPTPVTLNPSAFLVLFASDKDRALAGSQLHTNFKLNKAGEYLALVAPDGVTVVDEYSPAFPVQFSDASYGLAQLGSTSDETLIEVGASCTALVPTSNTLGTSWTNHDFNPIGWTLGNTGVGYERSSGYDSLLGLDVESAMYNQNGSVYMRIPFNLTDPDEITALELQIQYDDGFVAYLNGVRVGGANDPVAPLYNSLSTGENLDQDAVNFESFPLNQHLSQLREGANVLAIQGLNRTLNSSDMLIRPRLIGTRLTNPELGGPGYFLNPSPGAPNGVEQGLPASEVSISEASKTFISPFQVTLGGGATGQTIRYTLDRSAPTATSSAYSGPLTISNSTQLRARLFGSNNSSGPIAMASYLRLGSDLQNFSSNLPIVILENWNGGTPPESNNLDGFWAIIEPDATTNNRAEMLDPLHLATRVGMHRRGSSSSGWPKYTLALEAQDEDGLDQGIAPLGMPEESDWILSGRYQFDHALMRNDLIYRLSNEAGEYAVRTRFVEVFNNTNGGPLTYASDYFGVYSLMEKIKRDDQRVDVTKIGPGDTTEPNVSGGYLFKMDRADPGDGGFNVNTMGTFRWVDPKEEEIEQTPAQKTWLIGNLNELDRALYSTTWTHPNTGKHFTDYLDQDSWLRHHWCNVLAMNVDAFRLSGYYYKHRSDTNGGKVGAGPIWDFDRTMGSTDGRDDNPQAWNGTGDSSKAWGDDRYPWWGRALVNPDFRQAHTDLWQELRKDVFSTSNIYSIINEFAAQIDFQDPSGLNPGLSNSPAERNFDQWPGSNHPNEVRILKNWLRTRADWIDTQYTAAPNFTVPPGMVAGGTTVSFSGAGGTVYYTTDNTDPRLPGGGISPSASTSLPITIDPTTIITARAYDSTPHDPLTSWSGPLRGTFLVGAIAKASNFIITEVHYAPLPPATPAELAVATDASQFEFLELQNISTTATIDLTDVHFEAGIDFTFTGSAITSLQPGERVLIICDQAAFTARYGTIHNDRIAGEFSPTRLDNAGERILLVDALGDPIADFFYNDQAPWPTEAGFTGYSMVLQSLALPNPDYLDPSNWRSSGLLGGNPATTDSTPLVGSPTVDQDQDQSNALLEHAFGTDDSDPADTPNIYLAAVQSLVVDQISNDYLTISFQRNLSADDIVIRPQLSYDLETWLSGDTELVFLSERNQGDGTSQVTYRTTRPYAPLTEPRVFLRIEVSLP